SCITMACGDTPKTVLLRGSPSACECVAEGSIKPGHLVALNSSGTIVVHVTACGVAGRVDGREKCVVVGGLGTNYASGDAVLYWAAKSGDQFYAWLENGASVSAGDLLQSNGSGELEEAVEGDTTTAEGNVTDVTFPGHVVCRALEDVDASGGATRIRV